MSNKNVKPGHYPDKTIFIYFGHYKNIIEKRI